MVGVVRPRSIREIYPLLAPIRSARAAWVSPEFLRASSPFIPHYISPPRIEKSSTYHEIFFPNKTTATDACEAITCICSGLCLGNSSVSGHCSMSWAVRLPVPCPT